MGFNLLVVFGNYTTLFSQKWFIRRYAGTPVVIPQSSHLFAQPLDHPQQGPSNA
jgi:hypothetical protein